MSPLYSITTRYVCEWPSFSNSHAYHSNMSSGFMTLINGISYSSNISHHTVDSRAVHAVDDINYILYCFLYVDIQNDHWFYSYASEVINHINHPHWDPLSHRRNIDNNNIHCGWATNDKCQLSQYLECPILWQVKMLVYKVPRFILWCTQNEVQRYAIIMTEASLTSPYDRG